MASSDPAHAASGALAAARQALMHTAVFPRFFGLDLPRAFWVLWAGMLVNRLGAFVLPLLTVYLTKERGLSLSQAGQILAAFGAGSLLASFFGGVLADRLGRRATMLLSLCGSALAMLAFGAARGWTWLLLAALVLGALADLYRPASQAMIADLVPPERRAQAYSLFFWAINLGFAAAVSLGGVVAERSFALLFWADAATTLAFAAVVFALLPETRPEAPAAGPDGGPWAPFADRVYLPFLAINFLVVLVFMQFQTALPEAMRLSGRSTSEYGFALALNGLVIVLLQPLAGAVLSGFRRSRVLATSALLVGVGFALTGRAESLLGFAATVVVWTLGEVAMAPVNAAVVADLAPDHLRGRYQGAFGLTWSLGFLVAPLLGPAVIERVGPGALWAGCAAIGLSGALAHLALGRARAARLGRAVD